MAGGHAVAVKGLKQLVRDFGRVEKGLRRELQRELDSIGKGVRDMVRETAREQDLKDEGRLITGVRHRVVNSSTVVIRSTRTRKGFPYPSIYEYGGSAVRGNRSGRYAIARRSTIGARLAASGAARGLHGEYGPRAFVGPTVQKAIPYTTARLEVMLARLTSSAGLAGGGVWSSSGGADFAFAPTGGLL